MAGIRIATYVIGLIEGSSAGVGIPSDFIWTLVKYLVPVLAGFIALIKSDQWAKIIASVD